MASTASRGRPRSFDLDQALDAALELFWRDGYTATSTRDLEGALGVNQSSLYHAFGSKARLLTAALDRYEALIDRELVAPLETRGDGLDAITDFLEALHDWVTHDGRQGCMVINLMAEDGGHDTLITQRTQRYRQRVRAAIHEALRRAAAHGEIADDGLSERTELLFGVVLGLNIAVRGGADVTEINGLMRGVYRQVQEWRTASCDAAT